MNAKQILIVDDEEDVRTLTQLGLEMSTGWSVLTARSGQEALQMAETYHPSAILLDMMMPDMDGRTTLQHLKANPKTHSIPVILVTAKAQSFAQECFSGLEINAIFTKPFRPLKLAEQISATLGWA